MSDDPLDKNVSVGAELTPTGLNVNAKSRFIAAVDRLCGNAVDLLNVPMERRITKGRAENEGQRQLIEAMTKAAVDRMGKDPDFADRAIRNHLGISLERQGNKDGVVRHAIEDLSRNSVAEEAAPKLDPAFINKFERYAEDAATEALREKWGRVLAAEIRKPGTVTPMVMRIVDELDGETARLFEELCQSRLGESVPCCLVGKLGFRESQRLEGAGLIVAPGLGQLFNSVEFELQGKDTWWFGFRGRAFALPRPLEISPNSNSNEAPLRIGAKGKPAIPVYVLTDAGLAVSAILPDHSAAAFEQYIAKLISFAKDVPIQLWEATGTTGQWTSMGLAKVKGDDSSHEQSSNIS